MLESLFLLSYTFIKFCCILYQHFSWNARKIPIFRKKIALYSGLLILSPLGGAYPERALSIVEGVDYPELVRFCSELAT